MSIIEEYGNTSNLYANLNIGKGGRKMNVLEKALQIASMAHEGQYRKHTNIPYIVHPVAVGMLLQKAGYGEGLIAAGLLHDIVEDTNMTLADIERDFGPKIAEIVAGCSEPDKSLPWQERKEHSIQFLRTASDEIRVVVCADKLHNIRSIISDYEQYGEQIWERFNAGKQKQEWYYRNVVESLASATSFPLLEELKKAVNVLFNSH